jgi:hypothetical protein
MIILYQINNLCFATVVLIELFEMPKKNQKIWIPSKLKNNEQREYTPKAPSPASQFTLYFWKYSCGAS